MRWKRDKKLAMLDLERNGEGRIVMQNDGNMLLMVVLVESDRASDTRRNESR